MGKISKKEKTNILDDTEYYKELEKIQKENDEKLKDMINEVYSKFK